MEDSTAPFWKASIAAICALVLLCLAGCNREDKPTAQPEEHEPARAGVLHISEAVQKHIGLATQSAIRREVLDTLTVTGWLEAEPGREVTVKAPIAGFVTASTLQHLPHLRQVLERGEPLFSL